MKLSSSHFRCYAFAATPIGKVNAMASRYCSIGLSIAMTSFISIGTAVAGEKCYCRNANGEHVEVGKVACLKTNTGMQEAVCGMVLNNTAWKFTGKPCPVADGRGKHDKKAMLAIDLAP
jgi:hypothetical protein